MEEAGLLSQLGIHWKLLLSQAVNFLILLIILRAFVYKPLLSVIKERNKKIEQGLQKAEEASVRLKEVDAIAKKHLQKADQESILIIENTQARAKLLEQSLQKKTEDHQKELLAKLQESHRRQQEEVQSLVFSQASELVKKIMVKTVQLNPKDIDQALIQKAMLEAKKDESA